MKKFILILLIIPFGCTENNTEEPNIEDPIIDECAVCNEGVCAEEKYEFPDISGMTNWEQCPNLLEKRKACLQIPDACLEILSTKGLLEACLYYPYNMEISFSNNYQTGFISLVRQFNGYRELFQRPDLINSLIEKYAGISDEVSAIQSQDDIDKVRFSYRHFVFEFILGQDVVVENLSDEQKKTLVLLSFENKELKNNNPDIFSSFYDSGRYLLYAKIVINDPDFEFESAEQKDFVSGFIQNPRFYDQQTAEYIENYIYEKYKQ